MDMSAKILVAFMVLCGGWVQVKDHVEGGMEARWPDTADGSKPVGVGLVLICSTQQAVRLERQGQEEETRSTKHTR